MKNFPKVLIATPIAEHKYYCINDFIKNVKELSYPNSDFIMVDNSKDEKACELVKEFNPGVSVEHSGFYGTTRKSQEKSYERIREKFLKGGYDYLFTLESDLFPPEGIIEELMANDKDVCGAVYMIKGASCKNTSVPCVTTGKFAFVNGRVQEAFMSFFELDGELKRIHGGCGLGCALIKRKVLEKVRFRSDMCHCDTYFHRDAHRLGFETWIDTRFIIPHYPSQYPEWF